MQGKISKRAKNGAKSAIKQKAKRIKVRFAINFTKHKRILNE